MEKESQDKVSKGIASKIPSLQYLLVSQLKMGDMLKEKLWFCYTIKLLADKV